MSLPRTLFLFAVGLSVMAVSPSARALPMIFDVEENETENGVTPTTLNFGGGVNGTYSTADAGWYRMIKADG